MKSAIRSALIPILAILLLVVGRYQPIWSDTIDSIIQVYAADTPSADDQEKLLRAALESFQQEKFGDALAQLDKAHQQFDNLPPGRIAIGLFFGEAGKNEQAQQQFELAATIDPDNPLTHDALGRLALGEGRNSDAELQFKRAVELLEASKLPPIRRENLIREAQLGLATVAERRGQWATAQQYLTSVLKRKSRDSTTRRRLARALFYLHKPKSAYREFVQTTKLDESYEPAEITLARLYTGQANHKAAEKWLQRGRQEHADNSLVAVTYGAWLLDRNRIEDAATQAKLAADLDADDPNVKSLLGTLAMVLGKYEQAETIFQNLQNANPGSFDFGNQLALAMVEQTDPSKHQRAFQIAERNAQLYPQNLAALATRGWVYFKLGRAAEALQLLQTAMAGGPVSADLAYFYAKVLAANSADDPQQMKNARSVLEQALATDGRFIRRSQAAAWLKELSKQPEENKTDK